MRVNQLLSYGKFLVSRSSLTRNPCIAQFVNQTAHSGSERFQRESAVEAGTGARNQTLTNGSVVHERFEVATEFIRICRRRKEAIEPMDHDFGDATGPERDDRDVAVQRFQNDQTERFTRRRM